MTRAERQGLTEPGLFVWAVVTFVVVWGLYAYCN